MNNFTFAILLFNKDLSQFNTTYTSIQSNYSDHPVLCSVKEDMDDLIIEKIQTRCPVIKAKSTTMSLVNEAIKASTTDWIFFTVSGNWVHGGINRKLGNFVKEESNVCYTINMSYPNNNLKMNFIDANLHGMFLNKNFMDKTGYFPDAIMESSRSDVMLSKYFWSDEALKYGVKFKGIIGLTGRK